MSDAPSGTRLGAVLVLLASALTGLLLASALVIRIDEKELSGLEWGEAPTAPELSGSPVPGPLPVRLVDAGGVGIPADTAAWGEGYSHATYAFDHLILDRPPWVDPEGLRTVRRDWQRHLDRVGAYGSNAVVLDAFLEVLNFDGEGPGAVYPEGGPLRARHLAFRDAYGVMVRDAAARGIGVFMKTDMPAVTPELEAHLRRTTGGLDSDDPAFWAVYARGMEELFTVLPDLEGVVVRIGEAGPLFNAEGVEYASYMGVRTPDQLRLMLRTLLPVFERHGKLLVFRSWSVGVGELGDLHNDPGVYLEVLGGLDSPSLVVSTKFVRGDYFGFLPLNPTLLVGEHQRLVEFQARREFEGFGAFPNYMADAHRTALLEILRRNPRVVGTSLWAQEGGPLRAGPLSLYGVTGFWSWTDANVLATTRLSLDPTADPAALAAAWVRETVSSDPEVVAGLTEVLLRSREAVEKGFYVRPYATRRAEAGGVEVPPILWVWEWDIVGGWSGVVSTLYRGVEGSIEPAIAEGFEALALVREMRAGVAGLDEELREWPRYGSLHRSLVYQESLFEALAWYRAAFLRYYRWLDRGGDPEPWRAAAARFDEAAGAHLEDFGDDLDFPAFDLAPALASTERARRSSGHAGLARLLLLGVLLLGGLGTPWLSRRLRGVPGTRTGRVLLVGSVAPWRVHEAVDRPAAPSWGAGVLVLFLSPLTLSLVLRDPPGASTGISPVAVGLGVLLAGYVLVLRGSWHGTGRPGPAHAPAAVVPLSVLLVALLGVLAVRGPDYFWLLFWSEGVVRAGFLALTFAAFLWVLVSSYHMGHRLRPRPAFAGGAVLVAGGAALLLLGVLLPDLPVLLRALHDPLQILPMTPAIINGVTHYAGIPAGIGLAPGALGLLVATAGVLLRRSAGRHGT